MVDTIQFDNVENNDRHGDDEALTGFDAVDSRQNVDCVRTKHGQHSHVEVVE